MLRPLLFLALLAPAAADAEFASPPRASRSEQGTTVAFALRSPSDVEVAVLDARGGVVRHLAAGVLGGRNAPPAPLRAGLEQQLVWNGKDDLGGEAAGGPFTIRVRAGMRTRFGRMIGGSP